MLPRVVFLTVLVLLVHLGLGCNDSREPPDEVAVAYDAAVDSMADSASPPPVDAEIPPNPLFCRTDAECGTDAGALIGSCEEGFCVCTEGNFVQPGGYCGSTPPPDCAAQAGTCATTASDRCIAGDAITNASCGDASDVICCFESCRGEKLGGYGCRTADRVPAPLVCVNGWITCPAGMTLTRTYTP